MPKRRTEVYEEHDDDRRKKSKRRKSRRHDACHVDCCMCLAITFVVVFLVVGGVIMVVALAPKIMKCSCSDSKPANSTNVTKAVVSIGTTPADQWQECGLLAQQRKECLGTCPTPSPPPFVGPSGGGLGPSRASGIHRLDRSLLPAHYNVELRPRMYAGDDFRFDGAVEIFMTCERGTNVIVLNAKNLVIDKPSVNLRRQDSTGSIIQWRQLQMDEKNQLMTLSLFDYLQPGYRYFLSMRFNGTLLHADLLGFYRASYVYNNQTMYLAVSQFETVHARRAFPCFDEPSFKATFNVTLVRRTGYTALSNMPLRKTTDRGQGWKADEFERTPVMSPYTLAMVVCQYVSRERTTSRGTQIRIWTQPDYISYVDFALEITGPILEAYEDWTGVKYPISKLDQVVVKAFQAGAMENWGLVIYRESLLLFNPEFTTTTGKYAVASVIGHELAHQWFGNLVTMAWWDDTFLNEGFATYFGELVGVASLGAYWNMDQMFGQQILQVERIDGRPHSKPVRREGVQNPRSAFDKITYVKAGAILRMIKYFLGEATFKRAIQNYLREHAYGTVTKKDLFDALESQASADGTMTWDRRQTDLTAILNTWVEQSNYPLVDVMDHRNGTVTVTQSRFLSKPVGPEMPMMPSPFDQYIWEIPFTYADRDLLMNNGTKLEWIYRQNSTSFTPAPGMSGWKLVNVFLQGFYKVKYDNRTWSDILRQLNTDHTVIPILSRAEFINDANSLAQLGLLDDIQALSVTSYLKDDLAFLPWWVTFEHVVPFYEMLLIRTRTYPHFNRYILNLVLPSYDRLGWDNSKTNEHVEKYLRTLVLSQACKRNHPPCVDRALSLFRQFKSSPQNNPIHPDFRSFVYCTAVAHGGQEEFDFLAKIFFDTFRKKGGDYVANYLVTLIKSLACVREPWLIDYFIDVMTSNGFDNAINQLSRNPAAYDTLWRYLSANLKTLPPSQSSAALLAVVALTDSFSSPTDLTLLRDLLDNKMPYNVPMLNETLVAKVEKNIAWISENEKALQDWLSSVNAQGQGRRRRSTLGDLLRGVVPRAGEGQRVRPGTNIPDVLKTQEELDDLMHQVANNEGLKIVDKDRFTRILPHDFV